MQEPTVDVVCCKGTVLFQLDDCVMLVVNKRQDSHGGGRTERESHLVETEGAGYVDIVRPKHKLSLSWVEGVLANCDLKVDVLSPTSDRYVHRPLHRVGGVSNREGELVRACIGSRWIMFISQYSI